MLNPCCLLLLVSGLHGEKAFQSKTFRPFPGESVPAVVQESLDRKLSCDFVDTPVFDAIMFITAVAGTGALVDPYVYDDFKGNFTFATKGLPVKHVLDEALSRIGLVYTWRKRLLIITNEEQLREAAVIEKRRNAYFKKNLDAALSSNLKKQVAVDFVDMPLKKALAELAKKTSTAITCDSPDLQGLDIPVTLTLKGEDLRFVLDMVTFLLDLDYTVSNDGFVVAPVDEISRLRK